jgi:protein O-GlcNAc transferase
MRRFPGSRCRCRGYCTSGTPDLSERKTLERARLAHRQGDLAGAERLYQSALRRDGADADALQGLALVYAQAGELEAARQCLDRALGLHPSRAELHFLRAEILGGLDRREEAVEAYREALAIRPDYFEARVNLGDVLLQIERPAEALEVLDAATRLKPGDPAALNNRGNALQALKRHEEALRCFDEVLQRIPDHPDVLNNRATALLSLARYDAAEASCRRAIDARPDHWRAWRNLSRAQAARGALEDAVASLEAALVHGAPRVEQLQDLAQLQIELRRNRDAEQSLEQALKLDPGAAGTWSDLAVVLLHQDQYARALEACDRALALDAVNAGAWANRGLALRFLERYDEAIPAYESATRLGADAPYTAGLLAWLRLNLHDWRRHDEDVRRVVAAVRAGERACEPFELLFLSERADAQLRCAATFAEDRSPAAARPLWAGERYGHDRIRVAYVSADFRDHPMAYLITGLLERHDRGRFEVHGYAIGPRGTGEYASRIERACEHFEHLGESGEREIAARLREREVDIAVDLMGYTKFHRSGAFAMRPCPVQVNYLGFPATMGAGWMDYLLADAAVIPPGLEAHYAERIARLPGCYQANDAARATAPRAPTRAALGLPERGTVFCSFNKGAKISPAVFAAWAEILRACEGSVLWLQRASAHAQDNLRREAEARGVAGERLVFAELVPYPEHLARLSRADVALDTLPFNGGTTTSDALWAGVPVVTCPGEAFSARMSSSQLAAVGLPELSTSSLEDYRALAIRLGDDPAYRADIRHRLADNRATKPLFDTDRFRRHVEAAYEIMWRRAERGLPPESFSVDAIPD